VTFEEALVKVPPGDVHAWVSKLLDVEVRGCQVHPLLVGEQPFGVRDDGVNSQPLGPPAEQLVPWAYRQVAEVVRAVAEEEVLLRVLVIERRRAEPVGGE